MLSTPTIFPLFSEKPEEEKQPLMSASDLLKAHESDLKRNKMPPSTTSTVTSTPNNKQDTPFLGRGLARGSDIFFDESPNVRKRKSNDFDKAKVFLVSIVAIASSVRYLNGYEIPECFKRTLRGFNR